MAGSVVRAWSPHVLEQLALGDQLAAVANEHLEQLPLGRCEPHRLAGGVEDLLGAEVDREVLGRDDRRLFADGGPAHRQPAAGEELVHPERLGDVVVCPCVERRDLVVLVGRADSTTMGTCDQPSSFVDDGQAVYAGQPEVEQHDVGMMTGGQLQRLLSCHGEVDVVAVPVQVHRHGPADRRLVVDDEDPRHQFSLAATGRLMTIVVPPPGVSSTASSTAHRFDEASGDRQAQSDAGAGTMVVDDPLERLEHQLAID